MNNHTVYFVQLDNDDYEIGVDSETSQGFVLGSGRSAREAIANLLTAIDLVPLPRECFLRDKP